MLIWQHLFLLELRVVYWKSLQVFFTSSSMEMRKVAVRYKKKKKESVEKERIKERGKKMRMQVIKGK